MDSKEMILYEDEDILVVHKPGGISVQTSRIGQKDLVSMLKNYRVQKQEEPYIGIIHRLDQPVEGILVFAKTKEAAAGLSGQSQAHAMDKFYRAVVYNQTRNPIESGAEGTLADYLLKDGKTNTSRVVKENTKGARKAILQYQVLRVKDELAELRIKLETGRHHQIRVQMANANLPLVGDQKYGLKNMPFIQGIDRNVALCAVKIGFRHPKNGKQMEFEIEPENTTFGLV